MAAAGVAYRVGREAQSTYGEKWNGVQTGVLHHRHHFGVLSAKISPYVVPGDPKSGLLPRVSAAPPGDYGQADKRIQAYCYRLCLTDHPDNRLPFPEARRLRSAAVRAAAADLRGRLARDLPEVRPDPEPQDRHQQSRPVQHRQHRLQLRLSRSVLRAAPRDPEGARDLSEGVALLHRQRSARAEGRSGGDAAVGAGEGRVHQATAAGRTRSTSARRGA